MVADITDGNVPSIAIVGGGPSGLSLAALLEAYGVKDYVVYERSDRETKPRGACLDLHPGSGQKVFKEIGAYEELKKYGRWGEETIHYICNGKLERLFEFGEGRDAPEVDRFDIRRILSGVIPEQKVRWRTGVESSARDENGKIVLKLTNGTSVSGFKLVIGADGAFSKIRHLVTPAKLIYTGHTIFVTQIRPGNPHYKQTETAFTRSNMAICHNANAIWSAPQGTGTFNLDLCVPVPEDFELDVSDYDRVKKFFLQEQYFGSFDPRAQEIIKHSEGEFRPWRLYLMPPDCFNWKAQADVTLVGDAAHATTPWVGDGVNCAMRDALLLSKLLQERGVTEDAVEAYEKEMFVWAEDLIKRSKFSGEMFLEKENPTRLVEFFKSSMHTLVGHTDHV